MGTEIDPWDWTIDDVVREFCYDRTLWKNGHVGARLPDPVTLEHALRENDVEGATLLSNLGHSELKDEFRIKSIGQRSGVMWAIGQLRNRSEKYLSEQQSNLRLQQVIKSEFQTSTPSFQSFSATPGRPHSPGLPTMLSSPILTPISRKEGETAKEVVVSSTTVVSEAAGASNGLTIIPDNPSKRQTSNGLPEFNSRKKRKLNLAPPIPLSFVSSSVNKTQPASTTLMQLPSRSWLSGIVSETRSYLGPDKLTPDDIFFGSGGLSKPLNPDMDMKPLAEDGTNPSDFQIYLLPDRSIPGRQRFIHRQLIHFLRQPLLEVTRRGQPALAIFPYNQSTSIVTNSRSALVFTAMDEGVEVTREEAVTLASNTTPEDAMDMNSNHEWDFLLQRHGKDPSEELPLYGESEADTEWDNCEKEMEREIEAEKQSEHKPRVFLTGEQVIDVIDEEISGYIATWERQKRPLREHSAWKVWKKNPRDRRAALEKARIARIHSSDRLSKLKSSIIDEVWASVKSVRDQCKSLEETVIQHEEALFKVNLLQQGKSPARPAQEIKAKKRSARVLSTRDHDEISLDSDSEVATETESLNGFMEIDDQEPVAHLDLTQRYDSEESVAGMDEGMEDDEGIVKDNPDAPFDKGSVLDGNLQPDATTSNSDAKLPYSNASEAMALRNRIELSNVIDLTSDTEVVAPGPMMAEETVKPTANETKWSENPLKDPDNAILSWDMEDLKEREDYKRIVIKLLRTMPPKQYSELYKYVTFRSGKELVSIVEEQVESHTKGIAKHQAALGAEEVLRLYLCWFQRKPDHFNHLFINGLWGFASEIKKGSVQAVRTSIQKTDNKSLKDFCVFLERAFERHDAPIAVQDITEDRDAASDLDLDDDSDDEDIPPSQNTPHKTRRREIAESQNAKHMRARGRIHLKEHEDRTAAYLQHQSSELGDLTNIIINPGKKDDEAAIPINSYIAEKIQPHQVDGVRFMWREVVAANNKEEEMQGCLLAHTMGLGKTMQAIAFLVAIAEASASTHENVYSQVPECLRRQRSLILCPAALIFNWVNEFSLWNKNDRVGSLWSLEASSTKSERLATIQSWYSKRGVLLLSYPFFRTILANNEGKRNGQTPLTIEEHEIVQKQLLEGPTLVIADEAHYLKNVNSGISQAVGQIKTTSRIALTGSPLSNNLEEYFSMIDWIAPGYLGEMVEFKAHFVEPIQLGTYQDSTLDQRRISRKTLKTLIRILEPKIHRRDITVLKGNLKPKTEFMIRVPLTDMQFEAYCAFIELFCQRHGKTTNTTLWSWVNLLGQLCSHPYPFWSRLLEDNKESTAPLAIRTDQPVIATSDAQELSTDCTLPTVNQEVDSLEAAEAIPIQVSNELIDKLRVIFKPMDDNPRNFEHSSKSKLLLRLLKHFANMGDKVLVFSQSLATLDFLEKLVENKYRYFRLDGKTKMSERPKIIKEFNKANGPYTVFFISTKAGGVGFNLPGANRVVIYDFAFNPTHEEQAIGRAYRLGQTKPVYVYRFISAGTFEEKMHNTTVFKIQLAHRVVEKKNPKSLATRQKEWFRHPVKPDQEDLSEYLGKDKILDRVIKEMFEEGKSLICGVKTFETLQEESEEILTAEEEAEVNKMVADAQKRLEDPDAWRAEMTRRQFMQLQAVAQPQASDLANATPGLPRPFARMGAPMSSNSYDIPTSAFQDRERETFKWVGGK